MPALLQMEATWELDINCLTAWMPSSLHEFNGFNTITSNGYRYIGVLFVKYDKLKPIWIGVAYSLTQISFNNFPIDLCNFTVWCRILWTDILQVENPRSSQSEGGWGWGGPLKQPTVATAVRTFGWTLCIRPLYCEINSGSWTQLIRHSVVD